MRSRDTGGRRPASCRPVPISIPICLAACAALLVSCCAVPQDHPATTLGTDSREISASLARLLDEQAHDWNVGDIDGFMRHYWRSPALRFASGGVVQRGFDATLARYRTAYPDRAAMGTLAFEVLDVDVLASDAVLVLGGWRLTREAGNLGGLFTLVFRRIDGAWVIVHDHTSKGDS